MNRPSSQSEPRPYDRIQVRCHVCDASTALVLPFRYAFKDRLLYGVRCRSCSIVFVDPQPSPDEIASMYSEEYFTECSETCGAHGRAAYMEMASESEGERLAAARRLDRRLRGQIGRRGRLLEIGCGPGFFLAAMRRLGWDVQGLEISAYAVRHATEVLGVPVTLGAIAPSAFPDESFDAIFLGDVLEHLPDPRSSLSLLRGWLKPDGVVVVAVPSTMNLWSAKLGLTLYRLRGRFKTLRIPPYHLFEYVPASLRATLLASRFRVTELRQSAVPLRRMGLRGTFLENSGKVSLQVVAHATSLFFNAGGDRLTAVARRLEDSRSIQQTPV